VEGLAVITVDELTLRLLPMLREEEGLRLQVYDDATGLPIKPGTKVVGHPTIGVGRALDVNGITLEEADYLLANDIDKVAGQLDARLPWWRDMTLARQAVLASMAFQMGIGGVLAFSSTLRSMAAGDYPAAARGMLASKWAQQTPARAKRMAEMMRG
jgi:lysozyme